MATITLNLDGVVRQWAELRLCWRLGMYDLIAHNSQRLYQAQGLEKLIVGQGIKTLEEMMTYTDMIDGIAAAISVGRMTYDGTVLGMAELKDNVLNQLFLEG